MTDPVFPYYPIIALLTFVLALIPLPWHLQQWNTGTCFFMFWSATVSLVEGINSIVWHGNVRNVAPVWCDISSQIILLSNAGIGAATVCISRRLYMITALRGHYATRPERRRALIQDLCISLGIPVIALVLHFIVQPYRFDILEDVGCFPPTYNTVTGIVLHHMLPLIMGSISFIYGCLALRLYHKRRAEISLLMDKDNQPSAALTISRYFRLMTLTLIHVICTIPTGTFAIYHGITYRKPWVRADWSRIKTFPGKEWRGDPSWYGMVEINRWMVVFCGLVFFLLFGFATEARRSYVQAWQWVAKKVTGKKPTLPQWRSSTSKRSTMSGSTVIGESDSLSIKRLLASTPRSSSALSLKSSPFGAALETMNQKKSSIITEPGYEEIDLSPITPDSVPTPSTTTTLIPASNRPTHTRNSSIMQFNPSSGLVQPLVDVAPHAAQELPREPNDDTATYYIDPKYGLLSKKDYDALYSQTSH